MRYGRAVGQSPQGDQQTSEGVWLRRLHNPALLRQSRHTRMLCHNIFLLIQSMYELEIEPEF